MKLLAPLLAVSLIPSAASLAQSTDPAPAMPATTSTTTRAATSAVVDPRQAELIYVATVDARIRLKDSVADAPLYRSWSIRQASRRLRADDALAAALARAEPAGTPRFQESGICQVRLELPGSAIADVLTIAAQTARDPDLSPPKLTDSLTRLRTQTFFAVGESIAPAEFGRVKADFSPTWLALSPQFGPMCSDPLARTQCRDSSNRFVLFRLDEGIPLATSWL